MIRMRNFAGFLMALAFAVASGAAYAGDKQYTLVMSPTSGTSPVASMTATFTNKGNSSFNSLTINVPAGYALTGTPTSSRGQISYSGGVITVLNINLPTGTGQVLTVTMAGVSTAGTCGTGKSGNWTAVLWTGSTLGGNNFSQVGPSTTTTSILPACYTVSGSTSAGGTVTCSPSPVAAGGSSGCSVAINPGYTLTGFSANCGAPTTATSCTVSNVQSNQTVTASFSQIPYAINGSTSAGGSVTCNPTSVFYNGSSVCSVTTNPGYAFTGFSANCGAPTTATSCTVSNVQSNQTVTASFSQIPYAINGSVAAGGTVTCTPSPVFYNGSSTCTAAVNANFTLTGFSANCGAPTTATSCTVSNVQSSQTVTATYISNDLKITSAPSSAAVGKSFDVVIGSTPTGADVSFAAGCMASSSKSTLGDGSTKFTITINVLPAPPSTCTITFTAPNYNKIELPNMQVYNGVLFCGDYDSINSPSDPSYDPDLPSSVGGLGSSYVGAPGWGLRRGPNKDGAACVKVNYTCDMTANATTNVVTCTWDKNVVPTQLATFKYLFLWAPRPPQANGWTDYRPQVSWNIASPSASPTLPDWVPLLSCLSDLFPALPVLPTTILPTIPGVSPFTDAANLPGNGGHAWYQPGQTALVCGGQQGWTAVGGPGNPLLQIWNIIIDEADLKVSGP